MRIWIYSILSILILNSCEQKQTQNDITGVWLEGSYQLDEDYYRPFIFTIQFVEKGTMLLKKIGQIPDTLSYSGSLDSMFYMNDVKVFDAKISKDRVFSFRDNNLKQFKKVFPAKQIFSSQNIYDLLENKYWQSQDETLYFDTKNKLLKRYGLNNEKYLKYCFDIDSFENIYLLSKYGNAYNCNANKQFLEQITNISENQFEVIRWKDDGFKKVKYTSIKKPEGLKDEPADFQLCDKYLKKNFIYHHYYASGTIYKGGIYKINKIVSSKYQKPDIKENGIVRIRFVVNCEGKTGMFEVLELDNNYKEKKFATDIPQQLLKITQDLEDWLPGVRNEESVDAYKFLTFKIKDSEITEIFP